MAKDCKPTEEHWFVLQMKANQACTKLKVPWRQREDAISYVLTHFKSFWDSWRPNELSWEGFSFVCAIKRIIDFLKIEMSARNGYSKFTEKQKICRMISLSTTKRENKDAENYTSIGDSIICTKTKEPHEILEIQETLEMLHDNLSEKYRDELHRWHDGEEGLTKKQTNRRGKIRKVAYSLIDSEDYVNWLCHIMIQKRRNKNKNARLSRNTYRISLLAEKMIPEARSERKTKNNKGVDSEKS